jgi:cytochrome c553
MSRNGRFRMFCPLALTVSMVVLLSAVLPVLKNGESSVRASTLHQDPGPAQANQSPQQAPCNGITSQEQNLEGSLAGVPKYQKTFVLVVGPGARDRVTAGDSPALHSLNIEINDDPSSQSVVADLQLTHVQTNSGQTSLRPLSDLSSGKVDAAIMWAPLADAGLSDLGLEDKVSIYSVDRPKDPPPAFRRQAPASPDACAASIADDLDSFGVLPAELLVPVNIRSLFGTPTPTFTMQGAEKGEQVFQQVCARCHGQYAVKDPTLAPVDLLVSIRRFQFIGFKYIVMNGRAQKGMPPLRGTVTEDQIALIFEYLQARSKNLLTASSR